MIGTPFPHWLTDPAMLTMSTRRAHEFALAFEPGLLVALQPGEHLRSLCRVGDEWAFQYVAGMASENP